MFGHFKNYSSKNQEIEISLPDVDINKMMYALSADSFVL